MKKYTTFAVLGIVVLGLLSFLFFIQQDPQIVIEAENITVNPYGKNPLTAEIVFETSVPGTITVTIKGKELGNADLSYKIEKNTTMHIVPVWGLYENHNNSVEIAFNGKYGKRTHEVVNILTEVPENSLTIDTSTNQHSLEQPLLFLVNGKMFDEHGNIRWLFSGKEPALYPLSGGFLAAESEDRSEVIIFNIIGKEVARYTIPNKVHHEIIEKTPGGNLLIATNNTEEKDLNAIIEIERTSGEIIKTWDVRDYFDEKRGTLAKRHPEAWFHLNSIQYDASDNTLLVSGRTQNLVAKIGYDDGRVHWILGNHQQWDQMYQEYLLTPTNFSIEKNPDQDWTYLQHTATLQANNRVLVYDNGAGRPGFSDSLNPFGENANGGYVRVVEYQINEKEKIVTKTFEYTDFPDVGSTKKGSVYITNDDYLLIGYGEFNHVTLIKKSTQEKLFEGSFGEGNFYRAYPISWTSIKDAVTTE